ncbi:hypothetical protein [Lactococcus kimchii]|uniref:hypothetical protein n=1 Tax=Lactococcus sp. S-13 TaxID=2507158 RepID=UPI00102369DA|nr:hypothetical protein [Lactococcus sp. S-13]RZI48413.1 hypothetical protein EQJ87_02515 [Lactococcus sp. S-13]
MFSSEYPKNNSKIVVTDKFGKVVNAGPFENVLQAQKVANKLNEEIENEEDYYKVVDLIQ